MTEELMSLEDIAIPKCWQNLLILPTDQRFSDIQDLPTDPGLYAMYTQDGRLMYVGKSNNIHHRLRQHERRSFWFNDWPAFYSCRPIEDHVMLHRVEVAHIYALTPSENRRYEPTYWRQHKKMAGLLQKLWGVE